MEESSEKLLTARLDKTVVLARNLTDLVKRTSLCALEQLGFGQLPYGLRQLL